MQEFKPTHVYSGGDHTTGWQAGEQVMFIKDDEYNPKFDGEYKNALGLTQYVTKATMVALPVEA